MSVRAVLTISALCLLLFALGVGGGRHDRYPPGVFPAAEPEQREPYSHAHWRRDEYLFTPLADYDITARIVLKSGYWFGHESALSPYDFGVAWGRASDQPVLDRLSFSASYRYLNFHFDGDPPLPLEELESHIANMHLIPASRSIERSLGRFNTGDIVHLTGSLVRIETAQGWHWESSLSRTDSGEGACELFWVTDASIVKHPP